jgi:hypothetical protein
MRIILQRPGNILISICDFSLFLQICVVPIDVLMKCMYYAPPRAFVWESPREARPDIIHMYKICTYHIKENAMDWGMCAHGKVTYTFWMENLKRKDYLGDLGIDGPRHS